MLLYRCAHCSYCHVTPVQLCPTVLRHLYSCVLLSSGSHNCMSSEHTCTVVSCVLLSSDCLRAPLGAHAGGSRGEEFALLLLFGTKVQRLTMLSAMQGLRSAAQQLYDFRNTHKNCKLRVLVISDGEDTRYSAVYLLYWYKSTNADVCYARASVVTTR